MEKIRPEILIGILTFMAIVGFGGAVIIGRMAVRRVPIRARLRDEPLDAGTLAGEEESRSILTWLQSIGAAVSPRGTSKELKRMLSRAGYSNRNAPLIFLGIKLVCFTTALALGIFSLVFLRDIFPMLLNVLLVLIGAMLGMMLPNFYLTARRLKRQAQVRSHLPDAVDLLEVCVSAGMGMDMAWRAVMAQVRRVSVVMADEMSLTDMEINLGGQRASALRHMAERTGADELNWLVSSFVQSQRFGTSLSETLRNFAAAMREDRMRRAEEAAEKMAVRILFPLVLFIFPTIIIVCAGPAGIKIAETFSGP